MNKLFKSSKAFLLIAFTSGVMLFSGCNDDDSSPDIIDEAVNEFYRCLEQRWQIRSIINHRGEAVIASEDAAMVISELTGEGGLIQFVGIAQTFADDPEALAEIERAFFDGTFSFSGEEPENETDPIRIVTANDTGALSTTFEFNNVGASGGTPLNDNEKLFLAISLVNGSQLFFDNLPE
ncbi:MAG: hypothetical protein AAFQ94_08235 [Bacteroidota bacterium]